MSKKFSISEGMLNGISKNVKKAIELEAKNSFNVQYIDIDKIRRSEKNFYEIINIDDLAEDIKLNGLNHNLVVRLIESGLYEIISGERRFTALSKLINEGNKQFITVPCKVIDVNDTDAEIILIQANAQTRELSDIEKLKQVQRLSALYKTKKANGEKVPGKIREIIANDLKLSPTQIGRYERINNKLIPPLKELLEEGNLTIANASEFSTLTEENQKVILDLIKSKVEISKTEATELKNKLREVEKAKQLEYINKQTIIEENIKLKNELNTVNKNAIKSTDELKQIEGQLIVNLKDELNSKYSIEIDAIKNQAKENFEEKERLKKENQELKSNALKGNSDQIKENYILLSELRNVHSSLMSIRKQHKNMNDKNIHISSDILEYLNKAINMSYTLTTIKNELK